MPLAKNNLNAARPWVRIAIVTFNSGAFTQRCIDALAAQTDSDFDVVIVDNNSTDGAVDGLRLPDVRFTLVKNSDNKGFAGGSNQGLKDGVTPYVMSLNPDTRLDKNALKHLRRAADAHPDIAMLSPVLWQTEAHDRMDGVGDTLSVFGIAWRNGYGQPLAVDTLFGVTEIFGPTGAAALYRRDVFEREGGFDDSFFCYFEDVDLAFRLRARGEVALLVPDATGVHDGGHSSDALPGFAVRQTSANAPQSITQNAPLVLLPVMLGLHIVAHLWFQFRNRGTDLAAARGEGFARGLRAIPKRLMARCRRRPYPFGASWRVGRRLSWTIRDVNARLHVHWRYPR